MGRWELCCGSFPGSSSSKGTVIFPRDPLAAHQHPADGIQVLLLPQPFPNHGITEGLQHISPKAIDGIPLGKSCIHNPWDSLWHGEAGAEPSQQPAPPGASAREERGGFGECQRKSSGMGPGFTWEELEFHMELVAFNPISSLAGSSLAGP